MSSLAQDELGHAAALYGLLGGLTGVDADAIAYDREPAEYRHARLLDHGRGDWAMTIARRYLYETADAVRLEALTGGSWAPLRRPRRQARPRGALSPDARRDLADAAGRGRRRVAGPPARRVRDAGTGCGHGLHAAPRGAGTGRGGDPGGRRCASSRRAGEPRSSRRSAALDLPGPADGPAPADGREGHGAAFDWLWGEFTMVRSSDPGGDLVSEGGIHVAVARARAGDGRRGRCLRRRRADVAAVARGPRRGHGPRAADGLDRRPRDGRRRRGRRGRDPRRAAADVRRLPGARADPRRRRRAARARRPAPGRRSRSSRPSPCRGRSDRITAAGRAALATAGIAPPTEPADVRCPYCGDGRVVMDSAFGPTQCRSLFFCRACRQPFEAIKPV